MKRYAIWIAMFITGLGTSCQRADLDLVTVNVVGEVSRPGRYQFSKKEGVIAALAQAGWFVKFADTHKIRVIQNSSGKKPAFTLVDVNKILAGMEADLPLSEDCTIYVGPKAVPF